MFSWKISIVLVLFQCRRKWHVITTDSWCLLEVLSLVISTLVMHSLHRRDTAPESNQLTDREKKNQISCIFPSALHLLSSDKHVHSYMHDTGEMHPRHSYFQPGLSYAVIRLLSFSIIFLKINNFGNFILTADINITGRLVVGKHMNQLIRSFKSILCFKA